MVHCQRDIRLFQLRAEHHMTQADLAEHINAARAAIAGYETRNRQPSHKKLAALAKTFHVSVDYLPDNCITPGTASISLEKERLLDQRVFELCRGLTIRSKEDVYEYLCLLKLREDQK